MRNLLIVTSSARGEASVSTRLANDLETRLRSRFPEIVAVRRDIGAEPIPHLRADTVEAIRGEPTSVAEEAARRLSDTLVAELRATDLIVIASPMYNFGMSSTLKAWFDHVLRRGVTFRYDETGPHGLLTGKQAVVIESRDGIYSDGAGAALDSQEPHIRTLLGFMGIEDVEWVRAEGLAFGPEASAQSIDRALEGIGSFADSDLKLAA